MGKYSSRDIAELANTIRQADGRFTFLTGAGMSISAGIPAAKGLLEEIHHKFPERFDRLEEQQRWDYGHCMQKLSPSERKTILSHHLSNSKINWAHIALACIMRKGFVKRVLTFNFDNVLARSCGLLGQYPATYDFGIAPARTTDFISDPSIIHLHGQGAGQVMKNSTIETQQHAKNIEPLISDVFNNSNLIVLGYSGEADQVFPIISEKYTGQTHLYWVGYEDNYKPHLSKLLTGTHREYCHYLGGSDADTFMIDLAQELDCFPPEIFADPASHLIAELKDVIAFPLDKVSLKRDILRDTINRLDKHKDYLQLNATERAVLQGRPDDIIRNEDEVDEKPEASDERDLQAWAHFEKAYELSDQATEYKDSELWRKTISEYERVIELKPEFAEAYFNLALAQAILARAEKEYSLYLKSIDNYKKADEINPGDYSTILNWATTQMNLGTATDNEDLLLGSVEKYETAHQLMTNDDNELYHNWATALSNLGRIRKDENLLSKAVLLYKKTLNISKDDSHAFYNLAITLTQLAELTKNKDTYEESLKNYEIAYSLAKDDANILNSWSWALAGLGQLTGEESLLEKAMQKYDEAVKINPEETYNRACLHAIRGDHNLCKLDLDIAEKAGTLPSTKHMLDDKDLNHVQKEEWFESLISRLRSIEVSRDN